MGGSQQQQQPTSLRPESGTPASSHPISGTSISWKSSTVKIPGLGASLKPLTTSAACSVKTFAELRPVLASTLPFWEWEVASTAQIVLEPLNNLGVHPQKVNRLTVKRHTHSVHDAYKLVSTKHALEMTSATFTRPFQCCSVRHNDVCLFVCLLQDASGHSNVQAGKAKELKIARKRRTARKANKLRVRPKCYKDSSG